MLFSETGFWHNEYMATIPLEKARSDLPALVERALAGEEIVIAAHGAAGVKLAPCPLVSSQAGEQRTSYRGRSVLKGKLDVAPQFFEPLSDEECGFTDSRCTP
jgi:antitoxin (DNA-binding transcriptional repressor) of toxin-antitoxin stability system